MASDNAELAALVAFLRSKAAVQDKVHIARAYAPARDLSGDIAVGDDCAAIPDVDGQHLLFAAEGMLESFVTADPWFAGYCAVMVNLSDVAAMGGWPLAIVDVLWTPSLAHSAAVWDGMAAASRAYGVPIVGGHTTLTMPGAAPHLAAAVLGRARQLITSFTAMPGDDLLMAVDLRGAYRGDKPFWNASVDAPPARLQADLRLLPELAAKGMRVAGKDISNGGIIGTLAMLLECSGVGAELNLDALPRPDGVDLGWWLISFPSYGYLLSVAPENTAAAIAHFTAAGISCAAVGTITAEPREIALRLGSARAIFQPRQGQPTAAGS